MGLQLCPFFLLGYAFLRICDISTRYRSDLIKQDSVIETIASLEAIDARRQRLSNNRRRMGHQLFLKSLRIFHFRHIVNAADLDRAQNCSYNRSSPDNDGWDVDKCCEAKFCRAAPKAAA